MAAGAAPAAGRGESGAGQEGAGGQRGCRGSPPCLGAGGARGRVGTQLRRLQAAGLRVRAGFGLGVRGGGGGERGAFELSSAVPEADGTA